MSQVPLIGRRSFTLSSLALGALLSSNRASFAQTDATPSTDLTDATRITFAGVPSVTGSGVSVTGNVVSIAAAGTYVASGETDDGMITVDAPDAEITLVLDGLILTSTSGPAIWLMNAAAATLTLADGSTNVLTDGGATEEDAVIYSNLSLTLNGTGSAEIHALQKEGIASTMHLTFDDGAWRIFALEDGINANADGVSEITINGGYIYIETETGDGIDSNGSITITGGTVISQGALMDMNAGIDADGDVTFDGGTVIATGTSLSSPTAASAQNALVFNYGRTLDAGTLIVITDEGGDELLAFAPAIDFQSILLSQPGLEDSATYSVYAGGTADGESVDGRYTPPVAELGEQIGTATTEEVRGGPGR